MEIKRLEGELNPQMKLTRTLIEASELYYAGKANLMSDAEFDKKVAELKEMEKKSGFAYEGSPTLSVGAEVVTELAKAKHEQPALSLDKVKYADREHLKKWLDGRGAVMMWKCDGLTVVLTYDNGKLTSAVTRGNGEEGSVITHNAKFFKGVPGTIPCYDHVVIRGEAMMTNTEFERVNAEAGGVYENARNLAAATIQMLDANESRKRKIIFKAFELVTPGVDVYIGDDVRSAGSFDTDINLRFMEERLSWMELLGFDIVDHEPVSSEDVLDKIEEWKEKVKDLPYPTDGLVISYDDLEEGWALGSTGHHPRWAIALKWTDETVTTTIRDIQWSVGSTGVITPVAVFDEIRLGLGSNVTRASLHNLSIMKRLGVKKNCKAEVYLANLIIPQIESCEGGDEEFEQPTKCPICGELTAMFISPAKVEILKCVNEKCGAQQIGKLMNAFGKDGLFVKGLGESQIEDLLNTKLITPDPDSVFMLSKRVFHDQEYKNRRQKLLSMDGWGEQKWANLMNAIEDARNTTLQKFLYALNIPLLGNDLSKKLAKFFQNSIDEFIEFIESVDEGAGKDDRYGYNRARDVLLVIDGVGKEKAQNICDWAEEVTACLEKWENFVAFVKELKFPELNTNSSDNSLAGLTFVITGSVHEYKNRDEFKASVEARGGKVAGSVSKNTTALVNNDVSSTSGKNQKAKELGVEIISEDEFISRYGK